MPRAERTDIVGLGIPELERVAAERGFRTFHGRQVFHWLYVKLATTFSAMSDLPAALRERLEEDFLIGVPSPSATRASARGDAVKYGFVLEGNAGIEAVALFDSNRRASFCVSSQAGCPVGCAFCATGRMGLVRNLTAAEIVGEVLALMRLHGKPDSILFMGMGEPLLNLDSVVKAVRFFASMEIGNRKITVSTCGIVKGIQRLAASGLKVRLALSMGSAIEEKRRALIPLAAHNPLRELETALVEFRRSAGRRVSLEYTLIEGVNDGDEDLEALARFSRATRSHVNLIRLNRVPGSVYHPSLKGKVDRFKEELASRGVEVSERYRKGEDIEGACGQLVSSFRGVEKPRE